MKKLLRKILLLKETSRGFSLVEVLVAIFVGLIIMGMSVVILGSTNSTALRVLSKTDAQMNTRTSISKVFANLADADSLEVCRIADNQTNQKQLDQNLVPPLAPLGHPGISSDECLETSSTGFVVALARPNQLCYFKAPHDAGGAISDRKPEVACIARGASGGGTGSNQDYRPVHPPVSNEFNPHGINIQNCVNKSSGLDEDLVYRYSCSTAAGSVNSINWPTNVNVISDVTVIADLGTNAPTPERTNLFDYTKSTTVGSESDLSNIVGVNVSFDIRYANGKGSDTSTYVFNQTIVLRKSLAALKEGYDG